MCDRCLAISRREILQTTTLVALGAIAAACRNGVVADLPDPLYEDHLVSETPGPPIHIDPKSITLPPPAPPQASEYGEIIPRKAWSHLPLMLAHGRPMEGVERITIHHSGDGKPFVDDSFAGVARHLQIVQQAHLQRGMIDIAYHFAVDRTGRVWQLRWMSYEGQHVRIGKNGTRWNEHNVGIVALGDFNLQAPTVPQRDRLFSLVHLVQQKYRVPRAAIKMHDELVTTDCPGRRLAPLIREARMRGVI
jgi:hypothetical protein